MARTYPQLDLDAQICFPLYAATRAVTQTYGRLLADVGMTYPQYLTMLALWQYGRLSLKDLALLLHLEPATASPLVKRLESDGLVARERSTEDERRLDITLTDAGRALRERALEVPAQVMSAVGMDVHEVSALRDGLGPFAGRRLGGA